ncbi:hypothetical protein [Carnobacterium maltaromaticum]|uniref:PTS sugar transporter subunit IIA n=1 Tax=Carnobacterium maltaromaticum TaxID=2751 RepID=UPI00295EE1CD|nr:hypothetical protein [Carnobacterium maltaromaticum]
MTIALVLVSHSELAAGMKAATEFVAGPQDNFYAVGLKEAGIESYRLELQELFLKLKKTVDSVIVISDIPAGSPGANALVVGQESQLMIEFVSGMNLALVLEFILTRETKSLDDLLKDGMDNARESIQQAQLQVVSESGEEEF